MNLRTRPSTSTKEKEKMRLPPALAHWSQSLGSSQLCIVGFPTGTYANYLNKTRAVRSLHTGFFLYKQYSQDYIQGSSCTNSTVRIAYRVLPVQTVQSGLHTGLYLFLSHLYFLWLLRMCTIEQVGWS